MTEANTESEAFGADPWLVAFWIALTGIPLPLSAWLLVRDGPNIDSLEMMACSAIGPVAVLLFTSRFRATFTTDQFEYRRWAPTIRVRYADIASIETTNVTPIARNAVGTFIVTHDGRRLPFWPKLFPRRATTRFFQLSKHTTNLTPPQSSPTTRLR